MGFKIDLKSLNLQSQPKSLEEAIDKTLDPFLNVPINRNTIHELSRSIFNLLDDGFSTKKQEFLDFSKGVFFCFGYSCFSGSEIPYFILIRWPDRGIGGVPLVCYCCKLDRLEQEQWKESIQVLNEFFLWYQPSRDCGKEWYFDFKPALQDFIGIEPDERSLFEILSSDDDIVINEDDMEK